MQFDQLKRGEFLSLLGGAAAAWPLGGAGAPTARADWERDGGAKHVVGIIMPLSFDEPFGIATKALRCALHVAPGEHIRISARKRHGIEGRKRGSRPSLMSLLLGLVQQATIAMLTMCAQYAGSRWLAVLLSDSASRK